MKFYKVLLVILVVPLLLGVSCGLRPKQKEAVPEEPTPKTEEKALFSSQEIENNSTEFVSRLAEAEARARRDFAGDAYLFSAKATLPPTFNKEGTVEKFLFASPSRADFIYQAEFSVSQNAVQRSFLYSRDFLKIQGLQKLPSLNSINVKHGYLKAVETAEASGGKEFRSQNPLDVIILTLKPGATIEAVIWQVNYQSKETRTFEVDARTGKLLTSPTATETTSPQAPTETTPTTTSPISPTSGFTTEASGR